MMETITTWAGPALDGAVPVLLAAVLWRLGRDSGAAQSALGVEPGSPRAARWRRARTPRRPRYGS